MEETPRNGNIGADSGNDISSLMLFNRNAHFSYIFKKTEKLVTAVYMITNFIKDNEPLKWKIRENALELLALNISLNTTALSERKDMIKEYQALSLEIVSLSSIAFHSGLISEMNSHVLSREFMNLLSTIEKDEDKKSTAETVLLHPGFFDVGAKQPEQRVVEKNTVASPDPSYKGQPLSSPGEHDVLKESGDGQRGPIKDNGQKESRHHDSKESRQTIILKLLSKKSGLGIKDFAESIKGCSEKTIQRELLSMVAQGVIKKEGERRWSTYSLS